MAKNKILNSVALIELAETVEYQQSVIKSLEESCEAYKSMANTWERMHKEAKERITDNVKLFEKISEIAESDTVNEQALLELDCTLIQVLLAYYKFEKR